jgi:hypothetical protein
VLLLPPVPIKTICSLQRRRITAHFDFNREVWNRTLSREDLFKMTNVDPLVQALMDSELRLNVWLNESELNFDLLRRDPVAAMRAANLGVEEDMLSALEDVMTGIARKLNAA